MKPNTNYQDPHERFQKADYVMANPSFNVNDVDADKVKNDPRFPFGLPGVNSQDKVSNGNYLLIYYFYSYQYDHGRADLLCNHRPHCRKG